MVVAVGADIAWILHALADVEIVSFVAIRVLASLRRDAPDDAVDPDVRIALDLPGIRVVVAVLEVRRPPSARPRRDTREGL